MNAYEYIDSFEPDNLIYDNNYPVDTKTVTLSSGLGIVERGTVVAFADATPDEAGKPWSGETATYAACIIADDIDTGDTSGDEVVAHVYRTGHFNRQALKLADGIDALTKLAEKQLQDAGIYLSNAAV